MGMCKKPEIGQTVWVFYEGYFYQEKVYALGKDSFFLESCRDPSIKVDFWEWWYAGYGATWFCTKDEMEEYFQTMYDDDYELVEVERTWYEVRKL